MHFRHLHVATVFTSWRSGRKILPADNGGVTRCYHVVITDAGVLYMVNTDDGVLYTVNGVANANEHGPFQTAKTATKNVTCLIISGGSPRSSRITADEWRMTGDWIYGVKTFRGGAWRNAEPPWTAVCEIIGQSGTWLYRGSFWDLCGNYGIYMTITGSMWQLRDLDPWQ